MLNFLSKFLSGKNTKVMSPKTNHFILGTNLNSALEKSNNQILFGCGCFWGAEKGFWKLPGVLYTAVGYAGGTKENPNYNEVCSGLTGHTEVVQVIWNNKLIDISDLLKLFWECHDPTQGNRQGNDNGTQYRSAIYTSNHDHYIKSIDSKIHYENDLRKNGLGTITTEIKEGIIFNKAEDYHQQYLAKPSSRPYCSAMPTKVVLGNFKGSNFKLRKEVWSNYNWDISHCILRGNNNQIELSGS